MNTVYGLGCRVRVTNSNKLKGLRIGNVPLRCNVVFKAHLEHRVSFSTFDILEPSF